MQIKWTELALDDLVLIFQGYRIIYLMGTNDIFVITVIHGSRNLSDIEKQPWNNDP